MKLKTFIRSRQVSPKQKWPQDVGTFVKLSYQLLQQYPQNSDFQNMPAGGWDNHRTSNMDFIARADNHTKKGKRARRHSNLWTNMTCNLLSCEKHNWQQHCDFFFQDIGKLIRSELSYLPPVPPFCCTPILCRPGGLTHLHLSRGSCGIIQVR